MGGVERDQMRQSRVADRRSHLCGILHAQIKDGKTEGRDGVKRAGAFLPWSWVFTGLVLRGQLAAVWLGLNSKLKSTGISFSPKSSMGEGALIPCKKEHSAHSPGV